MKPLSLLLLALLMPASAWAQAVQLQNNGGSLLGRRTADGANVSVTTCVNPASGAVESCGLSSYLATDESNTIFRAIETGAGGLTYLTIAGLPYTPSGTIRQIVQGEIGVQYRTTATGASGGYRLISAASTNAAVIKASAGRCIGWDLSNTSAAWRFVKLHNQASLPTAGTNIARVIGIPPNGKATFSLEGGIAFATGIGITVVAGAADADATAVGANDVVGDVYCN